MGTHSTFTVQTTNTEGCRVKGGGIISGYCEQIGNCSACSGRHVVQRVVPFHQQVLGLQHEQLL